jgi:hypothetical protein
LTFAIVLGIFKLYDVSETGSSVIRCKRRKNFTQLGPLATARLEHESIIKKRGYIGDGIVDRGII